MKEKSHRTQHPSALWFRCVISLPKTRIESPTDISLKSTDTPSSTCGQNKTTSPIWLKFSEYPSTRMYYTIVNLSCDTGTSKSLSDHPCKTKNRKVYPNVKSYLGGDAESLHILPIVISNSFLREFYWWWSYFTNLSWSHGTIFRYIQFIYSLLIDEDLCENWNLSIKFPCILLVNLCLWSGNFFIFPVRVSSFYSMWEC